MIWPLDLAALGVHWLDTSARSISSHLAGAKLGTRADRLLQHQQQQEGLHDGATDRRQLHLVGPGAGQDLSRRPLLFKR